MTITTVWRCSCSAGSARLCRGLLALGVGVLLFATGCRSSPVDTIAPRPSSEVADSEFQALLGAMIDPHAQLRTNKKVYVRGEVISFWVYNRTGASLYYVDRFYGLKGYVYDAGIRHWHQVYLGFFVDDPHEFVLPQAQHS